MINNKFLISIGCLLLSLSLINSLVVDVVSPSFQRAQILSAISSVFIILIGFLFERVKPYDLKKEKLEGKEVLFYLPDIDKDLLDELAWGTDTILTATAAANVLIYFDDKVIFKRGLFGPNEFIPGEVSNKAIISRKKIVFSNTKFYPSMSEFDSICQGLPSIVIFPISSNGLLIIGGWSPRCFTKSDEK